jgi:cysteine-rich repeat protein
VQPGQVVTVHMINVSGFGSAGAWMLQLPRCANGTSSAESGCTAFSQTALTYGNSGTTPVRVYLTVDADGTATGTFSFEVDSHALVCGNGLREGSEQCDDGNIFSSDGCTPDCKLEAGYACTSSNPSVCTRRPTDGICGNVQCPALPANAPTGTNLCCTTQAKCGIAYEEIYGATCFERDQAGNASNMCPNLTAYPPFVLTWPALTGCCRSDRKCGLTAAVGAGCVERTAVYDAMQDGYGSTYYYQTSPVTAVSCTP